MNQEAIGDGILQILGKAPMPAPEKVGPPCEHESDGFIYNWENREMEPPVNLLLMCTKCHCHYEEKNNGYKIEVP
jgi:hypothetical protein